MLATSNITTTCTSPRRNSQSGMAEYRKMVYGEILDTEQAYVADLNILCDRFLDPLKSLVPAAIQGELNVICTSASMLRDFHNAFWEELSSEGVSQKILATFEDKIPYFRMYSSFCANYASLSAVVDKQQRQDAKFAKQLDGLSKHADCRGLTFSSFLIKPVQRICKYQLFFRDLLSHVSPVGPTGVGPNPLHRRITHIKSAVEDISKEVNDKMFDMQRRAEAIAVYKKLAPDAAFDKDEFAELISKPHRVLMTELELDVQVLHKGKSKRKGMFRPYVGFLFNDIIALTKKEKRNSIINIKSDKRTEYRLKYVVDFETALIASDVDGIVNHARNSRKRLSGSSQASLQDSSTPIDGKEVVEESKGDDGDDPLHFIISSSSKSEVSFAFRGRGLMETSKLRSILSKAVNDYQHHVEQTSMQRLNTRRRNSFQAEEIASHPATPREPIPEDLVDLNDPVAMAAAAVAAMECEANDLLNDTANEGVAMTRGEQHLGESDTESQDTQQEEEDGDDCDACAGSGQVEASEPQVLTSSCTSTAQALIQNNPSIEHSNQLLGSHGRTSHSDVSVSVTDKLDHSQDTAQQPVAVVHASARQASNICQRTDTKSQPRPKKKNSFQLAYEARIGMSKIPVRETKASKLRKNQAQELLSLAATIPSTSPVVATVRHIQVPKQNAVFVQSFKERGVHGSGKDIRVSARRSTTPTPARARQIGFDASENAKKWSPSSKQSSPSSKQRSPSSKQRSPSSKQRSPSSKQRSPSSKQRSPSSKQRSPSSKQRSPSSKQMSPKQHSQSSANDEAPMKPNSGTPLTQDSIVSKRGNKPKKMGFSLTVGLAVDTNAPVAPISPTAAAFKKAASLSPFKRSPLRRKAPVKGYGLQAEEQNTCLVPDDAGNYSTTPTKHSHRRRPSFLERFVGSKNTDSET